MTTLYTTYEKRWDHGRISAHVFPRPVGTMWEWEEKEHLPRLILSTPYRDKGECGWDATLWSWCSNCCSAEPDSVGVDEGINLLVAPEQDRLRLRRKKYRKHKKRV